MAFIPTATNISDVGQKTTNILNAIRNGASATYQATVPVTKNNFESRQATMYAIMEGTNRNEFLDALYNRIGRVLLMTQTFEQPWGMFKKGIMEYGDTIEQIFVNIAEPMLYNPSVAEREVEKRVIPDVKTMFYFINFKTMYKQTVQEYSLKQAFLTETGLYDLVAAIITSMVNAAVNDEFLIMKYVLARAILDGRLTPKTIPTVTKANLEDIVTVIKGVSNDWLFPNNDYNSLKIVRQVPKKEQYVISTSTFDSATGVSVLAKAFNIDKAEFEGQNILVDSFGKFDLARLNKLLSDDPEYVPFTDEELEALNTIPAVMVDKDFFVQFDNQYLMNQRFNEQGLYFNHWLHKWSTTGVCYGANAVVFIEEDAGVTSVTVSPSSITTPPGSSVTLTATVATTGFANKDVVWTTNNDDVTVNANGAVSIPADVEGGTNITVTATSVFDSTKYGSATITVSGGTPTPPTITYTRTNGTGVTDTALTTQNESDTLIYTLGGGDAYYINSVDVQGVEYPDITLTGDIELGGTTPQQAVTVIGDTLYITLARDGAAPKTGTYSIDVYGVKDGGVSSVTITGTATFQSE